MRRHSSPKLSFQFLHIIVDSCYCPVFWFYPFSWVCEDTSLWLAFEYPWLLKGLQASAFTGHLGNIFGGVPAQVSLFLCFLLVEFYAFYRHKPFICHTHYCVIIDVSISFIQSYAISKSICYVCCWYLFPCCSPPVAAFGYIDVLIFNLV